MIHVILSFFGLFPTLSHQQTVKVAWKLRGTSVELQSHQNRGYLFVYLALTKKAWKVELIFAKSLFLFILPPLEKRYAAGAAA